MSQKHGRRNHRLRRKSQKAPFLLRRGKWVSNASDSSNSLLCMPSFAARAPRLRFASKAKLLFLRLGSAHQEEVARRSQHPYRVRQFGVHIVIQLRLLFHGALLSLPGNYEKTINGLFSLLSPMFFFTYSEVDSKMIKHWLYSCNLRPVYDRNTEICKLHLWSQFGGISTMLFWILVIPRDQIPKSESITTWGVVRI